MFEHLLEHLLETLVHNIAGVVELIGVIIIFFGIIKGIYLLIKGGFNFGNHEVGVELAKALSLALSFLLAAEILHSILTRTIEGLIVLLGIAALRVGLHFVLHWELKQAECHHHDHHKQDEKLAKNN